jgi:MATE family multidrug resistance protein
VARRRRTWFVAAYVLVAVWAFQLDGFIGTTGTRAMRNASLVAVACFLALAYPLVRVAGNGGLRIAFVGYAAARALRIGGPPAVPATLAHESVSGRR